MVMLPSIRRKYMNPRIPRGETVSMSECVVTLASDSVSYTGGTRVVGVTVTWNGEALSVNADYTLSFANNVNPGPATVTVTGMGQFSGSVTKTFYVVADGGGGSAWDFDLANATLVGTVALNVVNGTRVLPLVENFYENGDAVIPVHQWITNKLLVGFKLPPDINGEYHVSNIVNDISAYDGVLDKDGAYVDPSEDPLAASYQTPDVKHEHPFSFSGRQTGNWDEDYSMAEWLGRSGWTADSGTTIRIKPSERRSFTPVDFSSLLSWEISHARPPFFADDERMLFIPGPSMSLASFKFPIDPASSTKYFENVLGLQSYHTIWHSGFSPDGLQAVVSVSNNTLYHAALTSPYDFTNASIIGSITPELGCRSATVLNDGKMLFVGTASKIYEYSLVA